MVTPFLSTKFFIPRPRKALVRRDHLFEMLNDGIQGKLVLVSAPAGYGKTTLITSWLGTRKLPVAWVSVDAGDNEYFRFFGYLLEALGQKGLKVGKTLLQTLQSPMPPSQDIFVELFLKDISSISQECILVIDDFHLINNLAIHADLNKIIEGSPKELHFIICSRTELPFSVSRLRANDELVELTQKELSLTIDESGKYMNLVMKVGLQPVDIAVLRDRTEGWLVGMQLVALTLRGQTDPVSFIYSLKGDNRFIGDYLVDEVLLRIPADLQDFLLRTSVLSRMETSLCNYVLQIENSHEILESIDKRRLFIIPLDDKRQWFRYHHLFVEMLFDRLKRKSPEIVADLYHRASEWHATHGMKEDAVNYALEGNDYPRAAGLIIEIGLSLLSHGGWNQLLNWYNRIPDSEFHSQPDLWSTYFLTLINAGLITDAAKKLKELSAKGFMAPSPTGNVSSRLRGEMASFQGVVILHSEAEPARAKEVLAEACKDLFGDETPRMTFAVFNYGVSCYLLGEIDEAREMFEKSISWGVRDDFPLARVMGASYLGETMAITGQLQKAERLFLETIRYVKEVGLQQGAVFSKANLGLGALYYEWNRLEEAQQYLAEGLRLAEQGGYLNQLLFGCSTLARIQAMHGDREGEQETIQRARRVAQKYGDPPVPVMYIKAFEAEIALQQGDLFIPNNWLAGMHNSHEAANLFSQYEQIIHARVLAARENYASMSELIRPLWDLALRQGRVKNAITLEVLMAKCLFLSGEPLPAIAILQEALYKAEPDHFVRTFLDEGGVVISMIKQMLANGGDPKPNSEECSGDYLYFLLDEVAKDTLKASTSRPLARTVEGLEPLTDHELHILHMLEAGYPNKQISREMNISLNTVKYHLKNIYGKLGVVNRTQAARIIRKDGQ
jgi:LuxR family maltose regulon positive regulatory protein